MVRFTRPTCTMTADEYKAPDPTVAEMVHRNDAESERQRRRLQDAPTAQLKAVARDTNESRIARLNALLFLLIRRDPEMPDILLELFDDPDQQLWRTVIRSYRPDDARIKSRLRALLDDSREGNWSEAALALARSQEEALVPRFEMWLHEGDRPHRNVAIECLKALDTPGARRVLGDFWDRGGGDDQDRLVLAGALLRLGDNRGLSLLESVARRAQGRWSVAAATSIYACRPREGLNAMMHILDHGDLEAKQSMVNQIWNFARLPHAFTADGIHEARAWVESEMEKQATS